MLNPPQKTVPLLPLASGLLGCARVNMLAC